MLHYNYVTYDALRHSSQLVRANKDLVYLLDALKPWTIYVRGIRSTTVLWSKPDICHYHAYRSMPIECPPSSRRHHVTIPSGSPPLSTFSLE